MNHFRPAKLILYFTCCLLLLLLTTPADAVGRYVDNGDGILSDQTTGLMWQKADDGVERNFADSILYAENLTLGGCSDWRLPTIDELQTLLDKSYSPMIDPLFKCSSLYWSGSVEANNPSFAWSLNFSYGNMNQNAKTNAFFVRCVRSGQLPVSPPDTPTTIELTTPEEIENAPVQFSIVENRVGFVTNFPAYSAPVDIYLLVLTPAQELLSVDSNNRLTQNLVPYTLSQRDAFRTSAINIGEASSGNYLFGWFVAPSNLGDIMLSLNGLKFNLGIYWGDTLYKDKVSNSLDMEFMRIKPGMFIMGSPADETGKNMSYGGSDIDLELRHPVTLTKGFYMQTTEVTQGQWKAVMGNNPSMFSLCGDDCPVESVSWNDVQEFIKKLNGLWQGTYRLPTEAEWEYAARAGSTTPLATGPTPELANGEIINSEPGCIYEPSLNVMGWYCSNSYVAYEGYLNISEAPELYHTGTHPVAQKIENSWGLYDMHGNVYEWCQDWIGEYPWYAVTDPDGASPTNPDSSSKIIRGGSFISTAFECRSAHRFACRPDASYFLVGFRLVRL